MGIFRRNKDEDKLEDLPIIGASIDPTPQPAPDASQQSPAVATPHQGEPVEGNEDATPDADPDATPDPDSDAGLPHNADVAPDATPPISATGRRGFIGRAGRNSLPQIPTAGAMPPIISPPPIPTTPVQRGPLRDQTCPTCSEVAPGDAKFCEACGTDLVGGQALPEAEPAAPVATEPCVSCGADPSEIDAGYCSTCGTKQPAPRDHMEDDLGWIASVSDKGLRHHHNEDASAISDVDGAAVVVVCDGVSSTSRPEEASELAADHIRDLLVQAIESGADVEEAMRDAIESAHHRVAALDDDGPGEAPSCTVVAGVVERDNTGALHSTLGWLGDSRAYWIDANDDDTLTATQLTVDHSWAIDQTALGELDADAIAADSRAHSITRWLGADSTDFTPDVRTHTAAGGRLLVCTDGLWNYAAEGPAMAELIAGLPGTTIHTTRELVSFAKESGGHDNITVAMVNFAARSSADASEDAAPEQSAAGAPINSIPLPDETQGDTDD